MDYATQALRLSDAIAQDFSRVHCYTLLCIPAILRRDVGAAAELSARAIEICSEYNIPYWREWARMVAGWAKAHQGNAREALGEYREACNTYRDLGSKFCEPFFLFLLAEVAALAGATAEGLTAANQALAISKQTAEQWSQAEIYRLQSKLLVAGHGSELRDPVSCLQRGIEIATAQGANLLELRCAISLARMQIAEDKRQEAHDLLAPIYDRWPDGYHATDLEEAEALLGEL
jgi:predicted ATPase